MKKDNKHLFVVTYRDSNNKNHMVFVNSFKSVRNLEQRYGKFTINHLINDLAVAR